MVFCCGLPPPSSLPPRPSACRRRPANSGGIEEGNSIFQNTCVRDAVNERALLGREGGEISRPRRDVEQPDARVDAHGVEHRRDRLTGQAAEGIRIVLGCALPSLQLEAAKLLHYRCSSPRYGMTCPATMSTSRAIVR